MKKTTAAKAVFEDVEPTLSGKVSKTNFPSKVSDIQLPEVVVTNETEESNRRDTPSPQRNFDEIKLNFMPILAIESFVLLVAIVAKREMPPLRLKVEFDGQEKRRFALPEPVNFERLKSLLLSTRNTVNGQAVKNLIVKYFDDEGELIAIISDADLREAIILSDEMKQKVLKLVVTTVYAPEESKDSKSDANLSIRDEDKVIPSANLAPTKSVESKMERNEDLKSEDDELANFNAALQILLNRFVSEYFPTEEIPSLILLCSALLEGSEDRLTWEQFISFIKDGAPKIASLECFHEPESRRLLYSLEVVTKYMVNNIDSTISYPISLHFAPLFRFQSVLNKLSKIHGIPLQLQMILFNLSKCARKFESANTHYSPKPISKSDSETKTASLHEGVICDGCGMNPIVGFRFKCTICKDYDLCEKCEGSNTHPRDHEMIKYYKPVTVIRPFGLSKWRNSRLPRNIRENFSSPPRSQHDLHEGISSKFVTDVNIPDGSVLSGGDFQVKTWRLKNNGKEYWDKTVKLGYICGNKEVLLDNQLVYDVVELKSGEVGDVNVPLRVPMASGNYQLVFKLAKSGIQFGEEFWVKFVVE